MTFRKNLYEVVFMVVVVLLAVNLITKATANIKTTLNPIVSKN